jgi:hypothetical protein
MKGNAGEVEVYPGTRNAARPESGKFTTGIGIDGVGQGIRLRFH